MILDAFEECFPEERKRLEPLFQMFNSEKTFKVFITTRDHLLGELRSKLKPTTEAEIIAQGEDIKRLLAQRLLDQDLDESLKDEIVSKINEESQGLYGPYIMC